MTTSLPTACECAVPRERSRRRWILAGILVVLFALLILHYHRKKNSRVKNEQEVLASTVPMVYVAPASRGASKHFVSALGTVTALNSVLVRSRIDGEIMKVSFREGEFVREGALLAQIDPRPAQAALTQAQGQLIRDQALLKQAELDLHRYEPLAQHLAIPVQQKDQQDALVQQYRGAVEADSGQVDNANLQLTYSRITAPISGRIGLRLVDPGNIVHAGDSNGILTITQVQPIAVIFNLAEDDLPTLQKAIHANPNAAVEAWDRANQARIASGRILSLDNSIDPTSGTLRVKATFENKQGDLFPNEFVNIRVLTETRPEAVLIPETSVQRSGDSAYVYVLDGEQIVHVRYVKTGSNDAGKVEILSGLLPGNLVVTKGFDKLQDAIRVGVVHDDGAPQTGQGQ